MPGGRIVRQGQVLHLPRAADHAFEILTTQRMESGLVDDTEVGSIRHAAESDIPTSLSGKLGTTEICRIYRSLTKIAPQAENLRMTRLQPHQGGQTDGRHDEGRDKHQSDQQS